VHVLLLHFLHKDAMNDSSFYVRACACGNVN
jgi:hypothetical protein